MTDSTKALGPFSRAARVAFISLGENAETAGPDLVASVPVIKDLGRLAEDTKPGARLLDTLLTDFRKNFGLEYLMRFFFYGAGATNGFDSFGHFVRAVVPANNCFTYKAPNPEPGCEAFFRPPSVRSASAQREFFDPVDLQSVLEADQAEEELEGTATDAASGTDTDGDTSFEGGTAGASAKDMGTMLDFLVGGEESK